MVIQVFMHFQLFEIRFQDVVSVEPDVDSDYGQFRVILGMKGIEMFGFIITKTQILIIFVALALMLLTWVFVAFG